MVIFNSYVYLPEGTSQKTWWINGLRRPRTRLPHFRPISWFIEPPKVQALPDGKLKAGELPRGISSSRSGRKCPLVIHIAMENHHCFKGKSMEDINDLDDRWSWNSWAMGYSWNSWLCYQRVFLHLGIFHSSIGRPPCSLLVELVLGNCTIQWLFGWASWTETVAKWRFLKS